MEVKGISIMCLPSPELHHSDTYYVRGKDGYLVFKREEFTFTDMYGNTCSVLLWGTPEIESHQRWALKKK